MPKELTQYQKRKMRQAANANKKATRKNKRHASHDEPSEASFTERAQTCLMVIEFGSKKEIAEAREEILGMAQALETVLEEQK